MDIAVIGQGYVGITAAACLASAGHRVTGIETGRTRLAALQRAEAPIYEPGLQGLLAETVGAGALRFAGSLESLPHPVNAIVVAVGTPQLPSGGADLRQLHTAMKTIAALRERPRLVVIKSTVPPGTSERLLVHHSADCLAERYVYSPEFLSQGAALSGWRRPSRIVVGVHNENLLPLVQNLYEGIEAPWVVTTPTDAEMVKYAGNAFLATKISFINEIANLCDDVGADIDQVVEGIGLDPRVGSSFLRAGIGYGGSCFPKDVRALSHLSNLGGRSTPLLEAVVQVNNGQRLRAMRIIREHLEPGTGAVAVLGLSFKPGTDDIREAPSLKLVSELLALGFDVRVWDPAVSDEAAARSFPGCDRKASIEGAVDGARGAIVLTEWPEVLATDWAAAARRMAEPRLLIDARNCLDNRALTEFGLLYRGFGRRAGEPARERPLAVTRPAGSSSRTVKISRR